jgi:hypothetical protein
LNDRGDPIVLELNDRPSMKVTFPFEHVLKKSLITDAVPFVNLEGSEMRENPGNGWERLFPRDDRDSQYRVMRAIHQRALNVFGPRTAASTSATQVKAIVYPRPVPDKNRVMFRSYRYTFQ